VRGRQHDVECRIPRSKHKSICRDKRFLKSFLTSEEESLCSLYILILFWAARSCYRDMQRHSLPTRQLITSVSRTQTSRKSPSFAKFQPPLQCERLYGFPNHRVTTAASRSERSAGSGCLPVGVLFSDHVGRHATRSTDRGSAHRCFRQVALRPPGMSSEACRIRHSPVMKKPIAGVVKTTIVWPVARLGDLGVTVT